MQAVGNMGGLADLTLMQNFDLQASWDGFDTYSSPGLATSTAAVSIANTVNYKIFGRWLSKTTASIAFTAGAASNIANGFEQCFLLQLDSAGNGLLIPGTPSLGAGTSLFPERPSPSIVTLASAVTATGAQTVSLGSSGYTTPGGVAQLVNGTVIAVDEGANAENVTLTAVSPISNSSSVPSIAGNFTALHPVGTIIKQGFCPIGAVRIYNNSGSLFTAATTALTTTGLTVTYYNGYPLPMFQSAQ